MSKTPPDHNPPKPPFKETPVHGAVANALASPQAVTLQIQAQQTAFTGPLPPPEILQRYDAIHSGFANRIITMAEKEGDHRRMQERSQLDSDIAARVFALETDRKTIQHGFDIQRRGQNYAFLVVVATLIVASYFVHLGHELGGGLLGGGGIVALAYVFIHGHKGKTSTPMTITEAPRPENSDNPKTQ